MKKRSYLGFLIPLLVLILTSCTGPGAPTGPSKATINWWHISTDDPAKSTWQKMANEFMQSHPNVTIKITIVENDSYKPKLATVMQSGNPPDLFHSWGGGVLFQYAKAGLVKDITSSVQGDWGNSFVKSALDVYGQNGKYYGVPWDMGAVGFWYNKTLFTKAGISQPPATWSEFMQDVQKLKNAGITPIALGEGAKWPGHYWWVYLAVRLGGKAAFDKAYTRSGSFKDAAFIEAGKKLQELIALDPFPKGYLGLGYDDEQVQMGDSKAAMELMGQWAPSADKNSATDKKGPEIGFFPFPTVEGGAGSATDVMGGGGGFAIGKNAPPETVDFVKFLTSKQNQTTMVKEGSALPVVKGIDDNVADPGLKTVTQMVAQAGYYQLYYDQYLPPSMGQVILDATQGLFAKTLTPEAAAKMIDDAAAASLK
jgi:raffinose/stachyose/melibiose transport system substrate-binding protein